MHQSSWKMFQSEVWMHVTMCQWYTQLTPSQKFEKGTRVVQWPFSDLLCRYKAYKHGAPISSTTPTELPRTRSFSWIKRRQCSGARFSNFRKAHASTMCPWKRRWWNCIIKSFLTENFAGCSCSCLQAFGVWGLEVGGHLFLNRFLWGGKGNFLVILKSCTNHKCALWKHVMKI